MPQNTHLFVDTKTAAMKMTQNAEGPVEWAGTPAMTMKRKYIRDVGGGEGRRK